MTAILTATDIHHTYGSGETAFTALKGISLEVNKGEILLVMGPSGSGKTTFIQILGCLLRPSAGSVKLNGSDISSVNEGGRNRLRRENFGFIFQANNLFPMLTALENVMVALDLVGITGAAAKARAIELLTAVGLAERMHAYPAKLSGGQKQRVGIARALAGDPQILLADEPTAALDAQSGHKVIELFRQMAHEQGRAVVIVTHDPRILDLGDRIIRIEDGRLASDERTVTS